MYFLDSFNGTGILKRVYCLFVLASLIVINGCTSIANITKGLNSEVVVHNSNNISFLNLSDLKKPIKISLKVYKLVPDYDLSTEIDALNVIHNNEKYELTSDPTIADIIVNIRISSIMPITEQTLENLLKIWIYQNSADHTFVDNSEKLENTRTSFAALEDGFGVSIGSNKNSMKLDTTKKETDSNFLKNPDVLAGAALGGSISALFGISPALISIGAVVGAGTAGTMSYLTDISYNIAIVDISVQEKVINKPNSITKSKYKNISSLSKNTLKEVYIDESASKDIFIDHNTRLSIISGSMAILPRKIEKNTHFAILQLITEMLR